MNISIIVAIARNHGIGFENKLLYWLPNDLTGREDHPTDEKHLYPYSFINYSRIK